MTIQTTTRLLCPSCKHDDADFSALITVKGYTTAYFNMMEGNAPPRIVVDENTDWTAIDPEELTTDAYEVRCVNCDWEGPLTSLVLEEDEVEEDEAEDEVKKTKGTHLRPKAWWEDPMKTVIPPGKLCDGCDHNRHRHDEGHCTRCEAEEESCQYFKQDDMDLIESYRWDSSDPGQPVKFVFEGEDFAMSPTCDCDDCFAWAEKIVGGMIVV
jgi:hypothetical protein